MNSPAYPERPNIILITTDQQRADTIGTLGNAMIKTPNLDQFARDGITFSRAYTPSPVCVPARFALTTGIAPHRSGCIDNMAIPEGHESMMQVLAQAGYTTHGVGKMHFHPDHGGHRKWGFQTRDYSEELDLSDDYCRHLARHGYGHVQDPHGLRSEYYYVPQPSPLPASLHHTAWVADRSIDYIRHRDRRRPFFLWSSFIKPHPPFESPNPWNRLYRSLDMPDPYRPEDSAEFTCFWNKVQNRYKYVDDGSNGHLWRTIRAAYYGSISFIDYHIGRIVAQLGSEIENTVIIFTSDHGEMLGDYGCAGKRCMLEPAVRVPFLIRLPGRLSAGTTCATPASLLDIRPTMEELCRGQPSAPTDGVSLLALLRGENADRCVTSQFSHRSLGLYMITDGSTKYVYSAADGKEWALAPEGDTLREQILPIGNPRAQQLKARLIDQLGDDKGNGAVTDGRWHHYPRSEVPANPREGVLFQDPPDLYEDLGKLGTYGAPRRQTWRSLIDLTLPESFDPVTGLTLLAKRE